MIVTPDILARVLARFRVERGPLPTPCWIWTGYCDRDGYGRVMIGSKRDGSRRSALVHRVMFAAERGAPGRAVLLHACDRPACGNPLHLTPGTQTANVADMVSKGRGWWQGPAQLDALAAAAGAGSSRAAARLDEWSGRA